MEYSFNGLNVTSFESRRSEEIKKLIKYHNGNPRVAPSMRELPEAESLNVNTFADEIFNGRVDLLILTTGVGTRYLSNLMIDKFGSDKYLKALKSTKIVARGPKPVAALRELDLKPDITVPEPNTWKDILKTVEEYGIDLKDKSVFVQEYGITNERFIGALKDLGAIVNTIRIYKWGLPEDLNPLKDAIKSISEGREDCLIFTSSQQVINLLDIAAEQELERPLRDGIGRAIVGSIGPTTTETLIEKGISVDYEPNSPKMGNLVRELARRSSHLLEKKRIASQNGIATDKWNRIDMVWPSSAPDRKQITFNSEFMKACRLEKTDYTPIWLMRQAGRFLREYRELRSKVSFLDLCKKPALSAEVTLMAVDRLDVDAAIIFSDILLILESLGVGLEFSNDEGPLIKKPIRNEEDIKSLLDFETESLEFVYDAIKIVRKALDPKIPLLGFAGAPFTVASYAIEGGGSKNYINTKKMMYQDPLLWEIVMETLSQATGKYLNAQIDAGADAVQIFDSWVGCLSPDDYERYVLPYMKKLISGLRKDLPIIIFGTGTYSLLQLFNETGANVIGMDWRVDILEGWEKVGFNKAVQGNLDPVTLFSTPNYVANEARKIIDKVGRRPGHIFNLGHGVLPSTPVDNVLRLIDEVHEYSSEVKGD
ncbi:MAG: uroporphyrinogen decarboxylase [Thermodesulfobacteriota bacterium]